MIHAPRLRRCVIYALGILVIMPTVLVSCFWSLFAVVALYSFVFIEGPATWLESVMYLWLAATTVLGWVGLITGVKLYNHFLRSDAAPARPGLAWVGLLCGTVASISLISWLGGSLIFRLVFIGWPLMGACTFAWFLGSTHKKDDVVSPK